LQKHRLAIKKISATGRQRLLAYRWPGNVRELAHELERQCVRGRRGTGFLALPLGEVSAETGDAKESGCQEHRFQNRDLNWKEAIDRLMHMRLIRPKATCPPPHDCWGCARFVRYRLGKKSRKTNELDPERAKIGTWNGNTTQNIEW